jgi:chemotaxis protein methyltransferase CheR
MSPADLANLADLLQRRSGLVVTADKARLIESKLAPVAHRFGFRNCGALFAELPYPPEELACAITEAMTTNESSFFRDRAPFEHFRDVLVPALCASRARKRRLRIWCAAAACGQEAYSLAILLDEMGLAAQGWKIDLIATDLSHAAIARAKEGLYSQYEAQRGLPVQLLLKHFSQEGGNWRIAERLRRMVSFRTFNLLDHFGWLGEMDVIFCRNALIYFDAHSKEAVIAKLAEALAADGALVLGAKESGVDMSAWAADRVRGIYVRPSASQHQPARGRSIRHA